jgi:diguanylate cyclase (GGDEF)-like protein
VSAVQHDDAREPLRKTQVIVQLASLERQPCVRAGICLTVRLNASRNPLDCTHSITKNPPMPDDARYRPALKSDSSTQRKAVLFVVLVVVSLIVLDVWQTLTARAQAMRASEITTSNLARSLAQHADDAIKQSDTVLLGLIERIQVDGTEPAQVQRLRNLMQGWTRSMEQLQGLFIYDSQGNWVASSNPVDPPGINNADREYFRYHLDNPDPGVHVGPVIRSRSTNALVIPVSRRLSGADGKFAGVVLATLKVQYFNQFYAGFDLDERGVIALLLKDGTILLRRPFDENVIGSSMGKGRIFSELLPQAHKGTLMQRSLVDGVERMYSYHALRNYPLVLETAESKASLLASWYENLLRSAAFVLVVGIALSLYAATLIRQIRRGLRTEAELRNAHAALQKLAMQDGLTGLANRRQLDAALPDEIGRARRNSRPLGVIMLDIDHFKRFNDLYGHPAGDGCIKAVGQAVLNCVGRAGDLVVRYGGEEILILLPESDEAGTWQVAEKVLLAVRALAIPHAGSDVAIVTISAGVHVWRNSDPDVRAQSLIEAADQALYRAKTSGRNRIYPAHALMR